MCSRFSCIFVVDAPPRQIIVMPKKKRKLTDVLPGFWQVMRYFWPYTYRQKHLVAGSMGALIASLLLRLLEPWPLKLMIDYVVLANWGSSESGPAWAQGLSTTWVLVLLSLAVVVIAVLRAMAAFAANVGFFIVGNRTVLRLREVVYRHIQSLSLSFHRKSKSGDLITRITRDVTILRDVVSTAVLPLATSIAMLFLMLVVMVWVQWQLTLLALAVVPLFWVTTIRIGRKIRETARKQRRREGAIASVAAEVIGAIDTVQALSLEDMFSKKFMAENSRNQKEELKASRQSARLGRTTDVLLAIATALVLGYGGHLALKGSMTPGDLMIFVIYLRRAFRPAQQFAKYTARLAKATAAGERVIQVLEVVPEIQDRPDAIEAPPLDGAVELRDVTFGYDEARPVLRNVQLDVESGNRVAIVGSSGIGKTTLLGLIIRSYDPNQGEVRIDGRDLRDYQLASVRRQISVVPQDTTLFATTVRENIACGLEGIDADDVEDAARLANAHEFIARLPQGYETVLGERGVTLSRGQRQRIAIARAAVRATPILILDEPTTGLDGTNQHEVMEALQRLMKGRTVFLVTHDMDVAQRMDQIIELNDGRLKSWPLADSTASQTVQTLALDKI